MTYYDYFVGMLTSMRAMNADDLVCSREKAKSRMADFDVREMGQFSF